MAEKQDNTAQLNAAIDELRREMVRILRIEEMLGWLSRHLPHWVDRLPTLPRWMGIMFWIYLVVGLKGALLLAAWTTGNLQ